ncbi:hypothetical protein Nepgr_003361 [Nepenthes gracilis]|uniref:Uncharacterized protein n=1 Tax=Nepenthes gracilis TaxID=150966 RepID=A0AAD3RZE8_NEPGR|nr:hypothetical protein Nepgr_003361 [Nepenthes gracilis]
MAEERRQEIKAQTKEWSTVRKNRQKSKLWGSQISRGKLGYAPSLTKVICRIKQHQRQQRFYEDSEI